MKNSLSSFLLTLALAITPTVFAKDKSQSNEYKVFQESLLLKDLIADVLPPPGFIVESYLGTLQAIAELEAKGRGEKYLQLKDQLRQLRSGIIGKDLIDGYYSRIELWKNELKVPGGEFDELLKLMTVDAKNEVDIFFKAQDEVIKLIESGKFSKAKKIAMEDLLKSFSKHRLVLIDLVTKTQLQISKYEDQLKELMSKSGERKTPFKHSVEMRRKIIKLKDLISDVLPPPCYIVEAHLLTWQSLFMSEVSGASAAIEFFNKAELNNEEIFRVRREYWQKNLESPVLIKAFKSLGEFGATYFTEREKGFVGALRVSDLARAKQHLMSLDSIYEKHRGAVDSLVAEADNFYISLEKKLILQD